MLGEVRSFGQSFLVTGRCKNKSKGFGGKKHMKAIGFVPSYNFKNGVEGKIT